MEKRQEETELNGPVIIIIIWPRIMRHAANRQNGRQRRKSNKEKTKREREKCIRENWFGSLLLFLLLIN